MCSGGQLRPSGIKGYPWLSSLVSQALNPVVYTCSPSPCLVCEASPSAKDADPGLGWPSGKWDTYVSEKGRGKIA